MPMPPRARRRARTSDTIVAMENNPAAVLAELEQVIHARRQARADESYTAQLLAGDADRLLKKIMEESGELALAAAAGRRARIVEETADLWYHCLVLLARYNIPLRELAAVLSARRGQSGLAEKARRAPPQ